MGRTIVKAVEWTCDGCGSIQVVTDDMLILGYFGKVNHQYPEGGNNANWYACKEDCIAKAIVGALAESRDK